MIETSARTVARTTSVQMTIRRLRLSGAAACAVGPTTASLPRRASWAASSHPGEEVAEMTQMGFKREHLVTTSFKSDGRHARLSPVPCRLRPHEVGRASGRLACPGLPGGDV